MVTGVLGCQAGSVFSSVADHTAWSPKRCSARPSSVDRCCLHRLVPEPCSAANPPARQAVLETAVDDVSSHGGPPVVIGLRIACDHNAVASKKSQGHMI